MSDLTNVTTHDAWMALFNIRKKDLESVLTLLTKNNTLGIDNSKISKIMEHLDTAFDGIEAQVIIAQRDKQMEKGKL